MDISQLRFPKKLRHLWLLAVGIFVWTVVLPGGVAFIEKVFTDTQVASKIAVFPEIAKQNQEREAQKKLLEQIDGRLASSGLLKGEEINSLVSARENLKRAIAAAPSRVSAGFFTNSTTSVFLICYLCLTALLCLGLNEYPGLKLPNGRTFLAGLTGYIGFAVFNWLRNLNMYQHDPARKVYSYTHIDIGPASFFLQEFRLFGIFWLIAAVNLLCYASLKATSAKLSEFENPQGGIKLDSLADLSHFVSGNFAFWQGTSLLLAIAFLPWTYFYWSSLTVYGDRRYVESALLTHLFWGITWIAISVPTWISLRAWTKTKSAALVSLSDSQAKVLHELEPIGHMQLFVTSAVAFGSFLVPVIHSVISFMSGR